MNNLIYQKIKSQITNKHVNIVGIHGPQGIGKTTLSKFLYKKFTDESLKVVIFSIDQFYLQKNELATFIESCNDPIYKYRGLSGTHDLELMYDFLQKLIRGDKCFLPLYDKSIDNGIGDRSGYQKINYKPDLIIIEGWMLGYKPNDNIINELSLFNKLLKNYKIIQDLIDIWIILETDNIKNVINWRFKAEPTNGMSYNKFLLFMEPYIKVYENYYVDSLDKIILDKDKNII